MLYSTWFVAECKKVSWIVYYATNVSYEEREEWDSQGSSSYTLPFLRLLYVRGLQNLGNKL